MMLMFDDTDRFISMPPHYVFRLFVRLCLCESVREPVRASPLYLLGEWRYFNETGLS